MLTGLFRRDADVDYRWEFFDSGAEWVDGLRVVAIELHLAGSGVQRQVRRDRRHEPVRAAPGREYRELVNGGVAMAQLGVEPARMAKVMTPLVGWLKDRPETKAFLAKPKGWEGEAIVAPVSPVSRLVLSANPSFKETTKWNLA